MDKDLVNFINNHSESIDANEFDFLFALAPTAGIDAAKLLRVFMDAGLEPLKYMISIKSRMFYNYWSANPLIIPGNIEIAEMNSFADCQCKEVIFEDGIETLGSAAFKNASYLERVVLPASLKTLGSWIFFHCYNLKEIVYQGSRERLLAIAGNKQNACFVPSISIPDYKVRIICADGELTLSELQQ